MSKRISCTKRRCPNTAEHMRLMSSPSGHHSIGRDYNGNPIWDLAIPVFTQEGKLALASDGAEYYRPAFSFEYADALHGIFPPFDPKWLAPVAEIPQNEKSPGSQMSAGAI